MNNPTAVTGTGRPAWGFVAIGAILLALPPLLPAADKGPGRTGDPLANAATRPASAPAAPGPQPLRILCVGDSITAGYTDNPSWNVPFEFGYRSALYKRLTQAGYAVQFVGASPEPWNGAFGRPRNTPAPDLRPLGQDGHRGYGGWNTGSILAHIEEWLTADRPDVVLLMIGINDGGSPAARGNLNRIVQAVVARRPEADLIVAQITPTASYSKSIADYNTYIRDTLVPGCRAKGYRVSTVDQYKNLLTNGAIDPKLFSNGINHPNAAVYDRMAQTWFDGIRAVRPAPGAAGGKQAVAVARQWSGQHGARGSAGRLVVEDPKAWEAVWADMVGNTSPRPETPKVDFARHKVIAVFLGSRNTGGYSVRITAIEADGKLRVKVKESSPPPGAMVTQALTSPYHVVVIPRIDKPVEFVGE